MDLELTTPVAGNSWNVVPDNTGAGVVLAVLVLYFLARHFIVVLAVSDILLGFVAIGGFAGWLEFIPR